MVLFGARPARLAAAPLWPAAGTGIATATGIGVT